ncbi:unnamed protein product [Knipowitschia caucasica]|uniref:Uncharacterized protein n=1 Tax=Knipowitschia caucasica TaxID=637954 RepID=A0AAV2JSE7_KNICA
MSYRFGQGCRGEELVMHIQTRLEDMFTVSHLAENGFLLKHIQKNREGFVSLKLLTCLKKIRALTNNWYMTLAAAICSSQLEVSQDMSKVRSLNAYPGWLLRAPTSRRLMLWDLPSDWTSPLPRTPQTPRPGHTLPQHILHRLGSYGNITALWLLSPGQELPEELKCYAKRHKELGQSLCAVVKYSTLSAVRKAYDDLSGDQMVRTGEGLNVVALGFKSVYLTNTALENKEYDKDSTVNFPEAKEKMQKVEMQAVEKQEVKNQEVERQQAPAEAAGRKEFCGATGDSVYGPWLRKRRKACGNKNMVRVIRQPRGPSGTRGFHVRRKISP